MPSPHVQADVSIIVCTYNRSANLPECISCLAGQRDVESLAWEVLIVDNNSSDDTRVVVEDLMAQHPGLAMRYLFEGEQGLSAARNAGICGTSGNWYIFIDDDIRVTPDWLHSMASALQDNDADAVGGRIHLEKRLPIPAWIRPDMYGFLGYQDFGEESRQLDPAKQLPYGGNMGFHRRVAERIGLFDTGFGRKGEGKKREELLKGEETHYFHRLTDDGGSVFYAAGGLVYHRIEAFQLRKRYFRTIHFNMGFLAAYHDSRAYPRRFFGAPLFLYTQTLQAVMRYFGQLLTKGPSVAFRQQMNVGHRLGMLLGYRRAYKERV